MDAYKIGDRVCVSISNFSELSELIEKATQQAEQLRKTIDLLKRYDLEVKFGFEREGHQ